MYACAMRMLCRIKYVWVDGFGTKIYFNYDVCIEFISSYLLIITYNIKLGLCII